MTIDIASVNDAPIAEDDAATTDQSTPVVVDVQNSAWRYEVKLRNQINSSDSLLFLRTRFK